MKSEGLTKDELKLQKEILHTIVYFAGASIEEQEAIKKALNHYKR